MICPVCGAPAVETSKAGFVEVGEWNGKTYEEEADATQYRCTKETCNTTFYVE